MASQSAASIPGSNDLLYVVDRGERKFALVDIAGDSPPPPGAAGFDSHVRRWIDFRAVDQRLEGRSDDSPASL